MKKTSLVRIGIVLLVLISFVGCNKKPAKVGLLIHAFENERWASDKEYITNRIEELGGEVIFKLANNSQQIQNEQARQLLEDGVDVLIVVAVDQNESAEIVRMAQAKEVKVIAYDRLMRDCLLDYYVTTSSIRVGEVQAEYMSSLVPKGNFAMINGAKTDNNSLMMFLGQMNILQDKVESGDIRIIYSEFTNNWIRDEAYEQTIKILNLKDSVDVIICGNDEMARGVNTALEEANLLRKVKVISQDAELEIVQDIVKGKQTATIYKPLKEMAYKAAELAIELANGNEIKKDYTTVSNGKRLVPSYLMEPMLVNENTVSSTVIAEGYHRSEEIF